MDPLLQSLLGLEIKIRLEGSYGIFFCCLFHNFQDHSISANRHEDVDGGNVI